MRNDSIESQNIIWFSNDKLLKKIQYLTRHTLCAHCACVFFKYPLSFSHDVLSTLYGVGRMDIFIFSCNMLDTIISLLSHQHFVSISFLLRRFFFVVVAFARFLYIHYISTPNGYNIPFKSILWVCVRVTIEKHAKAGCVCFSVVEMTDAIIFKIEKFIRKRDNNSSKYSIFCAFFFFTFANLCIHHRQTHTDMHARYIHFFAIVTHKKWIMEQWLMQPESHARGLERKRGKQIKKRTQGISVIYYWLLAIGVWQMELFFSRWGGKSHCTSFNKLFGKIFSFFLQDNRKVRESIYYMSNSTAWILSMH